MKLGRIMAWGLLAVMAGGVHAGNVRKDAEASMVLTGTVDVNPDGSLHGYTIDRSEKVPPEVSPSSATTSRIGRSISLRRSPRGSIRR